MHIVSVPYRGATFLNPILLILETSKINSFRPLSGSYISQCVYNPYSNYDDGFRPLSGSYISQLNLELWMNGFVMFPSPIGELHFSIAGTFIRTSTGYKCFRPLSGSYISQSFARTYTSLVLEFPSPIGELHFSIKRSLPEALISSFRPLSGSYISQ